MARQFAVFDIDGTIIRWQLYHAIADGMAKASIIQASDYERVRRARMNWKRRAAEEAFQEYEQILIEVVNDATKGLHLDDYKQVVGGVFNEYKEQVYAYTRRLIEELRAKDYLLFAISASQTEIVQLLATYYGFDDFGGTTYEVVNEKFTGKYKLLKDTHKPEYLKQLVKKHNATWQGSIGVGDSASDVPLLAQVERPLAFNPDKKLFQHAQQQGWEIVIERKNMIYKLEHKNGSYVLA